MTISAALLARVRHAAMLGPDAGSDRAADILKLCDEYEIAVRWMLEKENIIHEAEKLREKLTKGTP